MTSAVGRGHPDHPNTPRRCMMAAMRITSLVCLLLAFGLAGFAWWGLFTVTGQHAYDEMDGLIPLGAGLLAAVLASCALVAWWFGRRIQMKRR